MYQRWGLKLIAATMLALTVFLLVKMNDLKQESAEVVLPQTTEEEVSGNYVDAPRGNGLCIVIDAGHGGIDSGKVGINGALEKDINLEMAFLLKGYLEEEGFTVVMTRETDDGLYDENASNRKMQDLQRRVELIDEAAPVMVISIHQNSYTEESVRGAQVFYYEGSEEGQALAQCIQDRMIADVDPTNTRDIKGNSDYYLLKKTNALTVIVECGFLSNYEEAELLLNNDYQEQMMQAITAGILDYLENN